MDIIGYKQEAQMALTTVLSFPAKVVAGKIAQIYKLSTDNNRDPKLFVDPNPPQHSEDMIDVQHNLF